MGTLADIESAMTPVEEVMKHPAFPTATWDLVPTRSGLLPVAEGRGGPFRIKWEIHGEGDIKIMLIMGLAAFKTLWQRQTLHFGHEKASRYSVLLMDNRGMGESDKPLMRYSTSEMARDGIEVLEHVGWVGPDGEGGKKTRAVHLVGMSMGGMIAQEMAMLIPEQLSTLSLISTAAKVENTVGFFENMSNNISLLTPKSVEVSTRRTALRLFAPAYILAPDEAHLPDPDRLSTVRPPAPDANGGKYGHFDNNYQRFAAGDLQKRLKTGQLTFKGFMLQLAAAAGHQKSPAQLAVMGDRVGRERIFVFHGAEDRMVAPELGRRLIGHLKPGNSIIMDGVGHSILSERWDWFNKRLEEQFALGEELDGRA